MDIEKSLFGGDSHQIRTDRISGFHCLVRVVQQRRHRGHRSVPERLQLVLADARRRRSPHLSLLPKPSIFAPEPMRPLHASCRAAMSNAWQPAESYPDPAIITLDQRFDAIK